MSKAGEPTETGGTRETAETSDGGRTRRTERSAPGSVAYALAAVVLLAGPAVTATSLAGFGYVSAAILAGAAGLDVLSRALVPGAESGPGARQRLARAAASFVAFGQGGLVFVAWSGGLIGPWWGWLTCGAYLLAMGRGHWMSRAWTERGLPASHAGLVLGAAYSLEEFVSPTVLSATLAGAAVALGVAVAVAFDMRRLGGRQSALVLVLAAAAVWHLLHVGLTT